MFLSLALLQRLIPNSDGSLFRRMELVRLIRTSQIKMCYHEKTEVGEPFNDWKIPEERKRGSQKKKKLSGRTGQVAWTNKKSIWTNRKHEGQDKIKKHDRQRCPARYIVIVLIIIISVSHPCVAEQRIFCLRVISVFPSLQGTSIVHSSLFSAVNIAIYVFILVIPFST